jgi:murein DD-endopeptidase MepM/ murein hydrolase activator NlpD
VSAGGVTVWKPAFGANVDERACAVRTPAASFKPVERQIFFAFIAREVRRGDSLRMEWVDPANTIAETAAYEDLPASAALCFITQLPVSGFPASARPGSWTLRIVVNGAELSRHGFEIQSDGNPDRVRIGSVTRRAAGSQTELLLDGAGFETTSVVHVAEYKRSGGWRYIHSLLPQAVTPNRASVTIPALPPGEYLAIVRNPDGFTSRPSNFVIATNAGYQLPLVPGERWVITQGPYGSFSHWRNSLHAYDIAPKTAKWVAAMRAGIAHTHDVGARQSHTRRTFGNYITIQHDDGEYSHYGHLAAGTFLVRTGDRVEAGQPLARVGNSGYTLGQGGGYHVHVHVTRSQAASSPSIPFKFAELAELAVTKLKGLEVASSSTATLRIPVHGDGSRRSLEGTVGVGGRWTDLLPVNPGAARLEGTLSWAGVGQHLSLGVVSPGGRLVDIDGRRFRVEQPEPGPWRLIVDGMRGSGEAMPFKVEVAITDPPPAPPKELKSRRRSSARTRSAYTR